MEEITELKKRLGWTSNKMAEWLGISRQALWKLETGRNQPSGSVKKSVARLHDHLDNVA